MHLLARYQFAVYVKAREHGRRIPYIPVFIGWDLVSNRLPYVGLIIKKIKDIKDFFKGKF